MKVNNMIKKLYSCFVVVIMYSYAIPPQLPNFGNSCYMNATLQLLFCLENLNSVVLHSTSPVEPISLAQYYKKVLQSKGQTHVSISDLRLLFYSVDLWITQAPSMRILDKLFKLDHISPINVQHIINDLDKELSSIAQKNPSTAAIKTQSYSFAHSFLLEPRLWQIVALPENERKKSLTMYFENQLIAYSPTCAQQDAGNALSKILEDLEISFPVVKSLITNTITDKTVQWDFVEYSNPLHQSITQLAVRKANLVDLIDEYVHEEKLEHYELLRVFSHLPLYAFFELRRLSGQFNFNNDPVTLPLRFYYKDTWLYENVKSENYQLRGAIIHSGGGSGGHYTAYVYDKGTASWYYCDDARISSLGNVLPSVNMQQIEQYATIVLYEKIEDVPALSLKNELMSFFQDLLTFAVHARS